MEPSETPKGTSEGKLTKGKQPSQIPQVSLSATYFLETSRATAKQWLLCLYLPHVYCTTYLSTCHSKQSTVKKYETVIKLY